MNEMSIEELIEVGVNFEAAIGYGTKEERARIPKNYSRIVLPTEIKEKIANLDLEITFLISGEIWCPDFQLNSSVIKMFLDLNKKFDMSIITMARGKKYLAPILGIEKEKFKGPTIVAINKDF